MIIRLKKYLKTCPIEIMDCNLNFALSKKLVKLSDYRYTLYTLSFNGNDYYYKVTPNEMDIIYDKYGDNIPNYLSCRVSLWYIDGLKPKTDSSLRLTWCYAYNAISGVLKDISYEGAILVDNSSEVSNIRDYLINHRKELYISFRKPLSISVR